MPEENNNLAQTALVDPPAKKPEAETPPERTGPAGSMIELVGTKGQNIKMLAVGEVVEGTILSKGKNEVYIDIPGYGLGVVRGRELFDDEKVLSNMQVNDEVYASVVELENRDGNVELSFRQAGHERIWSALAELVDKRLPVETKITDANKGGLMVEINNVAGFLPVSQLAPEHYPRVEEGDKSKILSALQQYIGTTMIVRVITADPEEEKLIVSERAALEEKLKEKFSELAVGKEVEGTVTGIVDFGIFIKFGQDLEGLVHISELAWQRIDDPRNLFKVGDKVKAKIISLDNNRVSLSIKRLTRDPWEDAIKKYTVGQTVSGKVTKLMPFGAFVELDDEIHGLAHVGELTGTKEEEEKEKLTEGKEYEFKIISIEPEEHRLGLSRKALTEPEATTEEPKDQNTDESKKEVVEDSKVKQTNEKPEENIDSDTTASPKE